MKQLLNLGSTIDILFVIIILVCTFINENVFPLLQLKRILETDDPNLIDNTFSFSNNSDTLLLLLGLRKGKK